LERSSSMVLRCCLLTNHRRHSRFLASSKTVMTPDSDRLKEVFAEALKIKSAAERGQYLDEACKNEPDLRQQVDSLLAAHEQPGGFLAQTMKLPMVEFESERMGSVIGRYKLLENIGEGGFGVVYMAEQVEPVQRKVALKIIKAGM